QLVRQFLHPEEYRRREAKPGDKHRAEQQEEHHPSRKHQGEPKAAGEHVHKRVQQDCQHRCQRNRHQQRSKLDQGGGGQNDEHAEYEARLHALTEQSMPFPATIKRERLKWHDLPSRSEEHTSELQSRENLVCRLLLEKKKKDKVQEVSAGCCN